MNRQPIGKMAHGCALILLYLDTIARPARASEIRKAVCRHYPEAPIYGCIGELQTAGRIKRITHERDALYGLAPGTNEGVSK